MATNKNAIIRYQTLDKCFRNTGKRYFMEDLIASCNQALYEFSGIQSGVKKRQVFDDIRFMKSPQGWSIPLKKHREGHRVYYRYDDVQFSINNQPLNETEENQLKEALLTLSRFKGMPQFEWMDELIAKLDAGLGLSQTETKIIEFEQNQYLKGLEFISPLYNAILYKKALAITYQGFKQKSPYEADFHPYFLKQYNNRWFLFSKAEGFDTITTLALDRIVSIEESKVSYQTNNLIDFEEYFEDVIGVSLLERTAEEITLKIEKSLYPYIQTKPLHGSQKVKEEQKDYVVITLEIVPNYEFEALVLSYGERMEVLSPIWIKDWIKNRIQEMLVNYK